MMDYTKLFFGGALIGTLVSCWSTIKAVGWKICTLVVKKASIEKVLSNNVLNYLRENYKHYYLHDRAFKEDYHYIKNNGRFSWTAWEKFDNCAILFLNGKIPFYYSSKSSSSKDKNGNATKIEECSIYYIRGTLDIKKIVSNSIHRVNTIAINLSKSDNKNDNRFYIKYVPGNTKDKQQEINYNFIAVSNQCLSHRVDDLGLQVSKSCLNNIILTEQNKQIIKLADLWKSNKSWYNEKDIPWKMGWLLHGPPGTGKTVLSRRIAEHLNMPLYVYRLGMLGNAEFCKEWQEMQKQTPCVALIEDFDNVFHGRDNIVSVDSFMERMSLMEDKPKEEDEEKVRSSFGRRLSFDTLLNTLDGAERYEGVLTIVTTNHIDTVDTALLDRPGRIDKVIELTYITKENQYIMIKHLLGDMPKAHSMAIEYIKSHQDKNITPAQLQEVCTSFALKCFYEDNLNVS